MTALTLRDHARGAIRDEVMRQAWALFAAQGFEATTVDQIAAASGMSRRTFFRYFVGKDELVLERLLESGQRLADALRGRPGDEPVWTALRAAFDVLTVPQDEHPGPARTLGRMLRTEAGMRASVLERDRRWQLQLTPLVAERLLLSSAGPESAVRAAAVTGSALACLDAAQGVWVTQPGVRLGVLLDEAMAAMTPR